MSSLMSRSAILTASRVSNFAIHVFSPMLLVRILDVDSYGQYQEFMIYAGLLTTVCAFAVDSSLTYFLPRFPERERSFLSQTSVITLTATGICIVVLLSGKSLLLQFASFDFVMPLAAYVFFYVNLNWLEYYWIAKRRPTLVLYYSAARLAVRIGVMLIVAFITRDVDSIVWSLIAVEAFRVVTVLVYLIKERVFVSDIRRDEVVEQLTFAAPLGASALVQNAGRSIGKLFIGSTFGPGMLAQYAVGSYLQPIVRVVRGGIEDAVYPELVRAHGKPGGALRLWQRVNVLNCVMFFPAFVLLVYYAEVIVAVLFTEAYLPAVPIFNVYAFFLLRRCFNADMLVRTSGRTSFMLWGTIAALTLNVILLMILSQKIGVVGPAVAFIVAEVALETYYAKQAVKRLNVTFAKLADWSSILRITASCILGLPILMGVEVLPVPQIVLAIVASGLYFSFVLWLAYTLGVKDVGRVVMYVWSRLSGGAKA